MNDEQRLDQMDALLAMINESSIEDVLKNLTLVCRGVEDADSYRNEPVRAAIFAYYAEGIEELTKGR